MPSEKDGIMIILSSPSGAGKTTLVKKLSKKRERKQKTYTAKFTRLSLGFSSILIISGLGIGMYAMQQVYFTDMQYQASQQVLEQVYASADDEVEISLSLIHI